MSHFLSLFFLLCSFYLAASPYVYILDIQVEGTKKTKRAVILRELDFSQGDSISQPTLQDRLLSNKQNILNTGLFTDVSILTENHDNNKVSILIKVKENWYIYPLFLFELADRNFNVWWQDKGHDPDRINFGIDLYHTNFTGNRDRLKLGLLLGYKQKVELEYHIPHLNKSQTFGLTFDSYYSRRKEIAYKSIGNKLAFDRKENLFQLHRFKAGITFQYRKKINTYHLFRLAFRQNKIADRVVQKLNPEYLSKGSTKQSVPLCSYQFIYDMRDVRPYPMKGNYLSASIVKEGFGIWKQRNALSLHLRYRQLIPLHKKFSIDVLLSAKTELLQKEQAYVDYQALGYLRDYMRGYELYVIDGKDFAYSQQTFKYELLKYRFDWGRFMPIRQFKKMPLRIMLTCYNDIGYVHTPQYSQENDLGNTLLWGAGIGLDFIVYYDKIVQIQFSRNHLNEYGLFLHHKLFL